MKQFYLIKDILIPPKNVRKEYWNRVVISNHKILMILVVLTMAIQIFNIFRVIFWSRSGLGTVNNRIYFVNLYHAWRLRYLSGHRADLKKENIRIAIDPKRGHGLLAVVVYGFKQL